MRALIDTNVLLDLFFEREPFVNEAKLIWEANRSGHFEGWIAPITPINIFYIGRKTKGRDAMHQALAALLATHQVCKLDAEVLNAALQLDCADFEDAVQIACSQAEELDAIITRDQSHYTASSLSVYTPTEFIAFLADQRDL
jgi:predicted nucleic acid-binding protein